MALTVSANLVDSKNKPRSGVWVQACFYNINGQPYGIGAATSTASGRVTIRANQITITGQQPRILLRTKSGRSYQNLSETPASFTRTVANFGKLTITDQPAVRVANTAFFASNMTLMQPADTAAAANVAETQKIKSLNSQLVSLNKLNTTLKATVAQKDAQIVKARQEAAQAQMAKVRLKDEQIAKLQKKITTLEQSGQAETETELEDLFDTTGRQIENASKKIASRHSGFRLSKVSMQLKLLPGAGGRGVRFVKRDDVDKTPADALSVVNVEYDTDEAAAPQAEAEPITVPDVGRYTQAMAGRKLAGAGLEYVIREEIVQPEPDKPNLDGRVLRQHPEAGSKVEPGTTVTLTIGHGR